MYLVVFLCLDNLGEDFQVVIITLVGDFQSSNFSITFGRFDDLLLDKARDLACLDADTVEVLVKQSHSPFGIAGDPVVDSV